MKTVNEMQAQINELNAQIIGIEKGITDENTVKLMEEIANLRDGVGKGYIEGDYYAETRYYSEIPGVKNLRFRWWDNNIVEVKVTSPKGLLLPGTVVVGDEEYLISVTFSSKYSDEINY